MPPEFLSTIKFQYNVFGREFTEEQEKLFTSLRETAKPALAKPSKDEYLRVIRLFTEEANRHPELNYLFI